MIWKYFLITAAHCFFDEYNQTPQKIGRYELAVSKVSRHYTTKDNGLTKFYKVLFVFFVHNLNSIKLGTAIYMESNNLVRNSSNYLWFFSFSLNQHQDTAHKLQLLLFTLNCN